jgi:glutathione peroxidase
MRHPAGQPGQDRSTRGIRPLDPHGRGTAKDFRVPNSSSTGVDPAGIGSIPGGFNYSRQRWPVDEWQKRVHFPIMKILLLLAALLLLQVAFAQAADSLYDVPLKDIDGKATSLKPYAGKVLLIVNVASKCGYTPQYTGLEATYEKYKDKGFAVLGFPCNQFGGQEPGTNEEIKQFCTSKYAVTFPMFDKLDVNGANRHALYVQLAGESSPFPGNIKWNFNKFLIGRDGKILKRFDSKTKPDSPELTQEIEAALAQK